MPGPQRRPGQGTPFPFPAPEGMWCVVCAGAILAQIRADENMKDHPELEQVMTLVSAAQFVYAGNSVCAHHYIVLLDAGADGP